MYFGRLIMKINIRKAVLDDAVVIAENNYRIAFETENIRFDKETLLKGAENVIKDESKGIYFLAEEDGRIIGQLMVTKEWSDWRNGEFWWIQSVHVSEEYRRKGVFRRLFEYLSEYASAQRNICGIRLYVEKDNKIAQNTYSTLGMKETYYRIYEIEK
jgi:ribosomal protein S18 acetylase RimI-like enzyme